MSSSNIGEYHFSWLWEAFFSSLEGVCNVYGSTKLVNSVAAAEEILIASTVYGAPEGQRFKRVRFDREDILDLRGKSTQLQFQGFSMTHHNHILAVHSFERTGTTVCEGHVIAVAFASCSPFNPSSLSYNLHVYFSPKNGYDLEDIRYCYCSLELNFKPSIVLDSRLKYEPDSERVIIVAGHDSESLTNRIHMYVQSEDKLTYLEWPSCGFFPEFDFSESGGGLITWVDILYLSSEPWIRLSVVSSENGQLQLAKVDCRGEGFRLIWVHTMSFDGPVTQAKFFSPTGSTNNPAEPKEESSECVNLVVCSALEPCVVYQDVANQAFATPIILPGSDKYDCVLCCEFADLDHDGVNEIIIGTFNRTIIAFKFEQDHYEELWYRKYPGPVRSMQVADLSQDGVNDLIVVTNDSVHIMQHDIDYITRLCKRKLLRPRSPPGRRGDGGEHSEDNDIGRGTCIESSARLAAPDSCVPPLPSASRNHTAHEVG